MYESAVWEGLYELALRNRRPVPRFASSSFKSWMLAFFSAVRMSIVEVSCSSAVAGACGGLLGSAAVFPPHSAGIGGARAGAREGSRKEFLTSPDVPAASPRPSCRAQQSATTGSSWGEWGDGMGFGAPRSTS